MGIKATIYRVNNENEILLNESETRILSKHYLSMSDKKPMVMSRALNSIFSPVDHINGLVIMKSASSPMKIAVRSSALDRLGIGY